MRGDFGTEFEINFFQASRDKKLVRNSLQPVFYLRTFNFLSFGDSKGRLYARRKEYHLKINIRLEWI